MNPEEGLALACDLRGLGYDAEEVAGCVRVRLPLWCSVTVEGEPGRFQLVPRIGSFSREGACLWSSWFWGLVFIAQILLFEPSWVLVLVAASGVMSLFGDVIHYILTESAVTTIRVLMVTKQAAQPAAAAARGRAMA